MDPLACPSCHRAMRIVAFITQTSVIDQILTHLRTRAAREAHGTARSPPINAGPRESEHRTRRTLVRPRAAGPLRMAPTPRDRAGPFGVRGRPTGASDRSPPGAAPHLGKRSRGADAASARSETARPPRGGVATSAIAKKMNEVNPHRNWAQRIVKRAKVYGVVQDEAAFLQLMTG